MKGRSGHRVQGVASLSAALMAALAVHACGSPEDAPPPPPASPLTVEAPSGPPPPMGLQGLVRDIRLHLQDLPQLAVQHPQEARDVVLRVHFIFLEPLLRFYGPVAELPGGDAVAAGVVEVEELVLSLRSTMEGRNGPNPERIRAITDALETRLDQLLVAADEAGIRPPLEVGW